MGEQDRDDLGMQVRAAWIAWARTQPNPKPSWLVSYDELPEPDKEADRQIGEALTAPLRARLESVETALRDAISYLAEVGPHHLDSGMDDSGCDRVMTGLVAALGASESSLRASDAEAGEEKDNLCPE